MKKKFKSYYRFEEKDFKNLWKNCLFILDTSFITNLYRYPQDVRNDFFFIIEKIQDRIWVPYHAALEFHRNRLFVIAEQKGKFKAIQKLLDENYSKYQNEILKLQLKKRHTCIDQDYLISTLQKSVTEIKEYLSKLDSEQIDVNDDDGLLRKITKLLEDRIGNSPSSQEEIYNINKEGEDRFNKKIPPGYQDQQKGKTNEIFTYGGINYQKQYGDLIIWKQILQKAKTSKLKYVILLTDDMKEDWWLRINGKNIGTRPELVEEISRVSDVDYFHIYNSSQFLKYAKKYLEIDVKDSSVKISTELNEFYRKELLQKNKNVEPKAENVFDEVVEYFSHTLINSNDQVTSRIAETNAYAFALDDYYLNEAYYDKLEGCIFFDAVIYLKGDQDEDKMFYGDKIIIKVSGKIINDYDEWIISEYEVQETEVE